jgi:hypothetical protein
MLHDVIDPHRAASPPGHPRPLRRSMSSVTVNTVIWWTSRSTTSRGLHFIQIPVDRPPIAIGTNIMLHGMPPAVEHLVPGDQWPPTLSPTKTSKSTRIHWTKHQLAQDLHGRNTLLTRDTTKLAQSFTILYLNNRKRKTNKREYITINRTWDSYSLWFSSHRVLLKLKCIVITLGLRQLFIVICKSSCVA